jgi:HEAT repeat protein
MSKTKIAFQQVVNALLDSSQEFPHRYLTYFSDLAPESLQMLMEAWPRVGTERKHRLLAQLEDLIEEDTLVSFDDLGRALLSDSDPVVRKSAIRLLAECEDPHLIPTYVQIMKSDADESTRAEAASALGQFVMLGELDEIPASVHHAIEESLLAVVNGEDAAAVRRRALESLGFSNREEVSALIQSAFQRQDPEWVASALFAMGRSSDERWEGDVLSMLGNENRLVRLAAVQAAGELALVEARPLLLQLLEEEDDDDISSAAIWSLSQIGGDDARIYLENLLDRASDPDTIRFLEDALDNLAFTDDLNRFDLLAFDLDAGDLDLNEEDDEQG